MAMNRRDALKMLLGTAGLSLGMPGFAASGDYAGKLFVLVQADGGWDPTSFCDPKENHWAESASIQQAGNLPFAPFGNNASFFQKYFDRMLVINGVDAQTNSHTVGVVHNWSGRVSEGYPSLTALLSAHYAPALSMSYLNFGGYSQTGGVTRYTRVDDPQQLEEIARPNFVPWSEVGFLEAEDWELLKASRVARMGDLAAAPDLLPRAARNRGYYRTALETSEELAQFAALIPPAEELQQVEQSGAAYSALKQQAQIALLAFQAGVSIAADLYIGGFDTHQNHDPLHEPLLAFLADGVDYLWDYAETLGLADRLVVVIASDFGRTPHYNADNGKDHSPVGSVVVMEKNQSWTNRVIGGSNIFQHPDDDNANIALPVKVDPATLAQSDSGTIIYPKHVHKALRDYLGIGASPVTASFPFDNTELLPFFS